LAVAIEMGDVRASLEVLKGSGLLSPESVSVGSSDPAVLEREAAQAEACEGLLRDFVRGP
jgi:hypothetical protein